MSLNCAEFSHLKEKQYLGVGCCSWSVFAQDRRKLTDKACNVRHRPKLFDSNRYAELRVGEQEDWVDTEKHQES